MAKNEYVFDNTVRQPSKGITVHYPAHTRTIGEGEIHLQYAPTARCLFPGGPEIGGQLLLTENYIYFVGNTRRKELQYLEIPVVNIEKVKRRVLGLYLTVYVGAFEYSFTVSHIQDWMDTIARLKATPQQQFEAAVPAPNPRVTHFCPACGAKVESGAVYCCECGHPIK